MLEWKVRVLTLTIGLLGLLDQLQLSNNWNW
jgi:hypothetical protein